MAAELARSPTQNPEVPAAFALRVAMAGRDPEHIRDAQALHTSLPGSGALSVATRRLSEAALAAVEGRTDEARAGMVQAHAELERLGLQLDAAVAAVGAVGLLPDDPEIRRMAAAARPVLERLGARPLLAQLDAALGSSTSPAVREGASAEVVAD